MPQFKAAGSVPIGIYPPFFLGRPLSLNRKQIKAHGHVIGKSGSGKSYFLASLYIALLQAGFSVTLIDPAGDLAKLILTHLVAMGYYNDPSFYNKLVYLDIPRAYRHQRYFPFKLAQVEDEYLKRYFVPEEEIKKQIAQQDPTKGGGDNQVSRRVG